MVSLRSVFATVVAVLLMLAGAGFNARPRAVETVHLATGSVISLATPQFLTAGKRYAFTWSGGGPAQTYTLKSVRSDGWVIVEVADEATNPVHFVPGENPTRWLNVATAISIQEMRPHQ